MVSHATDGFIVALKRLPNIPATLTALLVILWPLGSRISVSSHASVHQHCQIRPTMAHVSDGPAGTVVLETRKRNWLEMSPSVYYAEHNKEPPPDQVILRERRGKVEKMVRVYEKLPSVEHLVVHSSSSSDSSLPSAPTVQDQVATVVESEVSILTSHRVQIETHANDNGLN